MTRADLSFIEALQFLSGSVRREALHAAFEHGVIDALAVRPMTKRNLLAEKNLDPRQGQVLLDLLAGHGVLRAGPTLRLSPKFRKALHCRDLLETQLAYARSTAIALTRSFSRSLKDPAACFADLAGFFINPPASLEGENEPWVRYMSTLTRYQAPLLIERLDLAPHRRVLDIGGNNGELAMALCRQSQNLEITVVDRPVVCSIGERHVRAHGMSERIRFARRDAIRGPLPTGADLVIFKSVLHDWPDADALRALDVAAAALAPGGRLIVFEMSKRDLASKPLGEHEIVDLPFLTCFREPSFYDEALLKRDFRERTISALDPIHFMLISGRKAL